MAFEKKKEKEKIPYDTTNMWNLNKKERKKRTL